MSGEIFLSAHVNIPYSGLTATLQTIVWLLQSLFILVPIDKKVIFQVLAIIKNVALTIFSHSIFV